MTTTQSCSNFARRIYDYQCEFHKNNSRDPSFSGFIMTQLVGRVITISVTLLLHAEAVCRAVAVCFLTIRDSCSKTNEELLNEHKVECTKAYGDSLKSFFSLFNRKVLEQDF